MTHNTPVVVHAPSNIWTPPFLGNPRLFTQEPQREFHIQWQPNAAAIPNLMYNSDNIKPAAETPMICERPTG